MLLTFSLCFGFGQLIGPCRRGNHRVLVGVRVLMISFYQVEGDMPSVMMIPKGSRTITQSTVTGIQPLQSR